MTSSSWRVGSWTTPTTTVTQPPVPSEVSPESRSKISTNIAGQFPSFVRDSFPTFIDFVKEYYKSQELKGYCIDIIQNWADYYNIDNYGELVTTTTLISAVTTSSTTIDVESTRDFPSEGLLLIDDEIIYYQSKGATLFENCGRGFNAVKAVGNISDYKFESTTAAVHTLGTEVVNLNNIFPLYMLGKFKEQFLNTFPNNLADGVTESTVIKRIKDFYSSKGTSRSFQFVLRALFGVESDVSYPRERIFKPSDAFYTSREIIRAVPVSGDPIELVGQVLYQDADPNDPNVGSARIYVKGVVEVFTANGTIYEIDVDTNNSLGTFVTPYKTVLSQDLGANLTDNVVTVDSTIGWPETNGKFRIEDEIISYTDKTVTQFIGCNRARENTNNVAHDAGQEVFAAFKIYGLSNVDGSEIQLKIFGGTRGVILNGGGKYYLPDSKVTTPAAPGFDSLDPIWDSYIYNVRRALRGESATLAAPANNGSVRCTVKTKEKHRLVRNDTVRILNAPEDIYNNNHTVVGIVDEFTFEFIFSFSPAFGISNFEFYIAREFAFGSSDDNSVNLAIKDTTGDVQNTYRSDTNAIVASTGIPTHKIGPFGSGDLDPGNQRYLKRIPLAPSIKSQKTSTPIGQIGIGSNGVPLFSFKSETTKKYGGIKSIEKIDGGSGYDITNPPTVQFEPDYQLDFAYASGARVVYQGRRYKALNPAKSSATVYPLHTAGIQTVGLIDWEYEGLAPTADVVITGSVTAINVTSGGAGYTTQPSVSIVGGGATSGNQAYATAQITDGTVTGINIVNGGVGYTSVPTISITGGGGVGATATAVCRGPVDSITITNAGSQHTYEPTVDLISGSGAVAYPSIINGKIESIIVTFGGSGYFGPPDVVITGDGVGATAFATVDLSTNIVTGITVSSKGIGYTAGATQVSIVYPGSGAVFQTKLTELSVNQAATGLELGSSTFVSPKTTDDFGGASFQGENYLIYGGEYGYLYNPKQLRFLLKDSIGIDNNGDLQELPPTVHSPIIGWAYDGHPIYGPYGYVDPENSAPFNEYKRIRSSYRVKTTRDALLSGLSDPLGTYIEDYEYVEGLGDLDRYNGRFCVTPEYPNGIYCYFTTITGTTGNPAYPYFVGSEFYGEADSVNWNGNGLQKNFTEDAIRYRAPFVGVDNITAKRKELDNKIDFFLALEDSTTLIVMETGETLTYIEDGIGYFSYYPFIRGGSADSLVVSSTNKFSSANIDQYLVEGGGQGYKVNDRLTFDNTGTGGEGISAIVSQVEGAPVTNLANIYGSLTEDGLDLYFGQITTDGFHYLQVGDVVNVSATDNSHSRTITSKIINGNYHFSYFALNSMKLLNPWQSGVAYQAGDLVHVGNRVYQAQYPAGTSGSSSLTHTSGTGSDGTVTWEYIRIRTDGNLFQNGWSSITGGSNYADGTYENVPLTTNGDGLSAKATIVVSGGSVTIVTITSFGYGYNIGDTISAANLNLGNNSGGSGFSITLTQVVRETQCRTTEAHQLKVGDLVNISGVSPVSYNKANYIVVRTQTLHRFTVKRNYASTTAANVTTGNSGGTAAEVYVKEPNLNLINGHSYLFNTEDASNSGKVLNFTLDPANTDVFTYKNVIDESRDPITNEQNSITIRMRDLPGIFYYHDVKHENVSPRTYTVTVAAKTTAHPLYNYGSGNGYYITGDKYGSVTQSPAISMSRGLTYTFNQNDASNSTHAIYFSESEDAYGGSLRYEKGVVYRINGEAVTWTQYVADFTTATTRSVEITPAVDSPDTLHYVCQNHLGMGNAITVKSDVTNSRYINIINDPILGTHTLTGKGDTTFSYRINGAAPETGYSTGITYSTTSIYPAGGVATITIGDNGRNYQTLPKLSGSTRSGSGATAIATISGGLSNVSISNSGSGYNQASLPTCVVTLPDFVDLTLTNVLGSFIPDEIIIGKAVQDNSTARGKVLSWNPVTSVLRLQPLRNTRVGAGQKGYIMFNAGKVYNINPSQIDAVGYADQFEFAVHDAQTGDPVKYVAAGTNPISNLTVGQTYYIINIGDAGRVKLAETPQLAEVGTAITITNSGVGTQTFNIRSRVYTGGASVAVIDSISGVQAVVAPAVSGAGKVTEITVTNEGTNYRAAPTVVFDDPYYGIISTVSVKTSTAAAYTASQTFTGVTQKSISGTSATGAEFTFVISGSGNIESVTVTNGGTAYNVADEITISGADLGGSDGTHDVVLDIETMIYTDVVSVDTLLNAAIDSVTVTNSGSGYLSAPTITAQGGNGINAALNSLILNEGVSGIQIEAAGEQFQSPPLINIEQKVGTGASILLKSSDMGEILKIGGENITFNYSHDRTLKPKLNTTYNLQLIRTQIIDYLDVVNGGANFVATPEIVLVGGQGSLFDLEPLVQNEIIQAVNVNNPGRGFTSAPTVQARVSHTFVALQSNSTLNFPYNPKLPTGTKIRLVEVSGQLPAPLVELTDYYVVAPTTANGLANNQVKLSTSLANANTETTIAFTSSPIGDPTTGQTYFTLQTTDLGDSIIAYMKPATFSIGERIYQGASTTSYTAYGFIKDWDPAGRVVSVELIEGDFVVGQPIFGEESAAFGQIHAFSRADAEFIVSPISTSAANWEKTTGFLDINEQRVYDSNRFQEFSYDISSPINIGDWKNPLKFAAHPAGFKVVGTQVLLSSVKKEFRPRSSLNLNASTPEDWWSSNTNVLGTTFNGTTFITPKPSAKNTGKLSAINNFALCKPDYTALVPTEVSIFGKQLLDVQKILSCIAYKVDDVSDRTLTFDGSSATIVNVGTERITITNHGFVEDQLVTYLSGGDRFLDARDLIINNIDYIVEESIGFLNVQYPTLTYDQAKCARDTRLVIAAWTNDLKYGGNYFTVDAAETYTTGTAVQHVLGEEAATIYTFNKARDLCLLAVTNDLPIGTYTTRVPQTDLSITNDAGGCADVKSAITTLAGIVTNVINNPSDPLPTTDTGNYPNNRFATPIGGLTNGNQYYIRYVDANTIELSEGLGTSAINLTSLGGGVSHSLNCKVDGTNDSFKLRVDGIDLNTKIGKTAGTSQLLLSINGIIANPATYSVLNNIVTFVTPPLSDSKIIIMYYDRADYNSSFVLDQVGDELQTFGSITPGTGYSDGVYTNVPLKNRRGSGSGATADITVTNGGVTNVTLNTAGNGYNNTDVLGLAESRIGEQLVNTFLPTNGTYAPASGDMELTIGSGHGLTAPTTHTPTGATYDPVTGFMVVTINNHGLKNRDQVKFADGAITFSCAYNGGGNESYPRSTDHISGKWIKVYECTTNTFTVQVLNAWPSTNTDEHTYVTAAPNSVSFATSTVRIANESLRFSCNYGGGGTAAYPRSTDPIGTRGRQRDIPVEAVSTDTITVNALNGTTPTNTDTHAWEGLSTYQFTPEDVIYRHWDGQLIIKLTGHELYKGDRIKLATGSIKMTCLEDDFATQHSYPRQGDPAEDTWLTIDQVSPDHFSVFVGETEGRYKTYTPVVGDTFYKPWYYDQNGNFDFSTPAGYLTLDIGPHDLQPGDAIKIKANSLVFTCDYGGDNFQTEKRYPRTLGESRAADIAKLGDGINSSYTNPATGLPGTSGQQNPLDFQGYDDGDYVYSKNGTSDTWIAVMATTANTISFYVGDAGAARTNSHVFVRADADCITASAHRFVSADNNCVERAVVAYGNRTFNRYADAAGLLRVNALKIAQSSYTVMVFDQYRQGNTSFDFMSYMNKCVRDTKLLINAVADNVEYGGNDAVYDAAKLYVDTIHLQGEEGQSVQVFNNAMEMCINIMRNTPSRNNSGVDWIEWRWFARDFTSAYANGWNYLLTKHASKGNKFAGVLPPIPGQTQNELVFRNPEGGGFTNNSEYYYGSTNGQIKDDTISVDESANQFYPQGKIVSVTVNVPSADQGNYQYNPAGGWGTGYGQKLIRDKHGNYRNASGASGSITASGSAGSYTITGATVTTGGNGFRVGDVIECRDVSSRAWKGTSTTSNGVGSAGAINHLTEQDHMITLTVTAVSTVDASDNIGSGDMYLHETNDYLEPEWETGDINGDGDYPSKHSWSFSDNSCQDVESTIRTLWGIVTQAVGTGAHTFVNSNTTGNITVTGGGSGPFTAVAPTTYDNTTGLMEMEIGSHSLTTSDTVTITANSLVFTCANDGNRSQKTYPRASDPSYNTAIAITAVTATTITVNVGTNTGSVANITRTAGTTNEFQVEVQDVSFNGVDTTFTTLSGGSAQVLPASDNFLIFLNSTLQIKGTDKAYTYSGSQITFSEPPLAGMDFYGFYFGKLTQLDDIAPFFDNKKKTFTMKQNTEPFSLESDNAAVQAQNNLLIFINGVYQEPGVAYSLTGSIIEFSEAPKAGSDCILFIYTGSAADILVSNTFNSIDPEDRVQIVSEGSDRRVATVSSSTTIDSYEFTGLRPSVAEFTATVTGGQVTQVTITDQGSNYEVPPILIFQGGGGEGATAETTIETGSGRVLSVVNLKGGAGYTSAPNVLVTHPMTLERKQRDRVLSNSNILASSHLTSTLSQTGTTINLKNVYFNTSQSNGFPDEGEVLIPFYDTSVTPNRWNMERILYGSKDVSGNTLTVATNGRGHEGTTAAAHTVLTGTYTSSGTTCTVNLGTNHNFTTGQRIYLDFTSGTGFDGTYIVTVVNAQVFTVEFPFARTTSGNVSLLPEVRLRSL